MCGTFIPQAIDRGLYRLSMITVSWPWKVHLGAACADAAAQTPATTKREIALIIDASGRAPGNSGALV
jgi:hypothetical protein